MFERSHTAEYQTVMPRLLKTVHEHRRDLRPAKPQFNLCDLAVQVCQVQLSLTSLQQDC